MISVSIEKLSIEYNVDTVYRNIDKVKNRMIVKVPMRQFPQARLRRMRSSTFSRRLMAETRLTVDDLIYPIFIVSGKGQRQAVASMPGIERISVDVLLKACCACFKEKLS
jgi:hypothetical protein